VAFRRFIELELPVLVQSSKFKIEPIIWIDALDIPLSKGENCSSLSCTYQELFKKYPPAFFFGMDSKNEQKQTSFNFTRTFFDLFF
jgi:hypothetical protein